MKEKTEEILNRWTDKIYPSKEVFGRALLKKGLKIYMGVDPTNPHLHLGHSTNFFLLREFQKLGHKIIFLIGDFTAQIGDPTGRAAARKPLTKKEISNNCKNYQKQAGEILDFKSKKNPAELAFNSQWLNKLKLGDLTKLAANFTQGQMIKRNMFRERLKRKEEIFLHEFLYPLFQGYDSVVLDADCEVGGTDQTFNMLIGRDLMKIYKNKEKFVITTPLLVNPKTGKKLMSKTESFIGLDSPPDEMYGKVMALPDEVIFDCFKLCTDVPLKEIQNIKNTLEQKITNPRDSKSRLAREIVELYHGKDKARIAEAEFIKVFREKETPTQIKTIKITPRSIMAKELLVKCDLAKSLSEAQRLIEQGAVSLDNQVLKDWRQILQIKKPIVLKAGKYRFVKLIP